MNRTRVSTCKGRSSKRSRVAYPPRLLPGMPQAEGEAVFAAPWMAQAFAMALALHQRGLFTWVEWADALSRHIGAAQDAGDADVVVVVDAGETYYRHWLAALEALVTEKGVSSASELGRWRAAWEQAAERTPHGQAISLQTGDFSDA